MDKPTSCNPKAVLKIAGAFIAWNIGSGFATGQEILQFFSSHGYVSYGIIMLNLIGLVFLGLTLLATGNEHKIGTFDHFNYYCGKRLGTVYSWLIPLTLFLIIAVQISAAGSAMSEFFGLNRHLGSALMAVMVVSAYLVGFEKLVRIVSSIGPVIIIFTLLVGTVTVVKEFGNLSYITQYEDTLALSKASPNWILSAVLYLSLCVFTAGTYYTALGKTATKLEVKTGAALGAVVFILVLAIMNTAILVNAKEIASLEIPTLYLAGRISHILAGTFSVILVLGMFSSSSTMMWTVCSRFHAHDIRKNQILAIVIGIAALVVGQFSFSQLVSLFYPLVGYMGLIYIGCVAWKGTRKRLHRADDNH